jgi:carbamoyl-phosphate synthase large subunit
LNNSPRILRTAVGSPVAPSVLRKIKEADSSVYVVGVDMNPLAPGKVFCDKFFTVPPVNDSTYIDVIRNICIEEKIDLFWPDLEEELVLFAGAIEDFKSLGIKILINSTNILAQTLDKWSTFKVLKELGIPVPASQLASDTYDGAYPVIAKPRRGRGSAGVSLIDAADQLPATGDYMIQEFLKGTEFTIDVLSDLEAKFLYASVRERSKTDSGISIIGKVVDRPDLVDYVKLASESIGLVGPTCFQFIESGEASGGFIEINPRIAGSVIFSILAGYPIIADILRLCRGAVAEGPVSIDFDSTFSRYWSAIKIE